MCSLRYADFYDMPSIDSRYDLDPAYARRCDLASHRLYKILHKEIQPLIRMPRHFMSVGLWDLCNTIADRTENIFDAYDYGIKDAAASFSTDLLKLSHWFGRFDLAPLRVLGEVEALIEYVESGRDAGIEEVAS
jgi:hypothetical protein